MKTYRAQVIEGCEEAARASGFVIIGQMPRMAEFYRKRVNEQIRAARSAADSTLMADAKAKLEFLRWVDSWTSAARHWTSDLMHTMCNHLSTIGYSLRYLVRAYVDHPQFRPEWGESDA